MITPCRRWPWRSVGPHVGNPPPFAAGRSAHTPQLRKLQGSGYLANLLSALMSENRMLAQKHGIAKRPLLIKIAPDLDWGELDSILQVALD